MKIKSIVALLLSFAVFPGLFSACGAPEEGDSTDTEEKAGSVTQETVDSSTADTDSQTESLTESETETEPKETAIPPEDFVPFASEGVMSDTKPFSYSYRIEEADIRRGGYIKVTATLKNCSGEEFKSYVEGYYSAPAATLYYMNSDGTRTYLYDWVLGIDGYDWYTYAPDEIQIGTETWQIPEDAPLGFYSFCVKLGGTGYEPNANAVFFDNVFFLSE